MKIISVKQTTSTLVLAANESTFRYQVSFMIDNIEHDNDDGDCYEVRHEMAGRRDINVGPDR